MQLVNESAFLVSMEDDILNEIVSSEDLKVCTVRFALNMVVTFSQVANSQLCKSTSTEIRKSLPQRVNRQQRVQRNAIQLCLVFSAESILGRHPERNYFTARIIQNGKFGYWRVEERLFILFGTRQCQNKGLFGNRFYFCATQFVDYNFRRYWSHFSV